MGKRGRDPDESDRNAKRRLKGGASASRPNENWTQLRSELGTKRTSVEKKQTVPHEQTLLLSLPEPSNPDSSLTRVISMDCEMVGAGSDGKKSVLARVSIVNEHGNVIYDAYVKPQEFITDFRTHVSGIRYKDIKEGESLTKVQEKVAELLSGRILVGHALRHDFKVLFLNHPKSDIRDTSSYSRFRSPQGRPRSLKHLAELFLRARIQNGPHSSVEDARAAMMLYVKYRSEWEASLKRRHRSKDC